MSPKTTVSHVVTADRVGAKFTEVALMLSRDEAIAAFETRAREPHDQTHLDAAWLVARDYDPDAIGKMYDSFIRTIAAPQYGGIARASQRYDIEATLQALEQLVALA